MQYRLNDALGLDDARKCKELGSNLPDPLNPADLAKGKVVDLNDASVKYLTGPKPQGKEYVALLEPAHSVRGEARAADITAPEKTVKHDK